MSKSPDKRDALAERLRAKDAAITGTLLAKIQNPEFARLVVDLKAAAQDAAVALEEQHYADLEHEHLGCDVAKTGIYAPPHVAPMSEWLPTAESINALPGSLRSYVHDLETRCDPAGDVAALAFAKDQVRQLEASNRVLRDRAAQKDPCADECAFRDSDGSTPCSRGRCLAAEGARLCTPSVLVPNGRDRASLALFPLPWSQSAGGYIVAADGRFVDVTVCGEIIVALINNLRSPDGAEIAT